jgi:putative FmdB family regulatory protein
MPLYEYDCTHCGEAFEELVSSSTPDDKVECPTCEREGGSVRKLSTFATGGGNKLGSQSSSSHSAPPSSGFS